MRASKIKNVQILKTLIRIFGKFEKLMHHEGRVDARDTQKRDMLLEAQEKLLKRMNDPVRGNKGLFVELDEANHKI